jgi:4-carboxymuconolactone decarboxylase
VEGCVTKTEEILRRLTLEDESVTQTLLAVPEWEGGPVVHGKTVAIARLGALIALGATVVSYESAVVQALTEGATAEEIIGALLAVAPLVGITRVTSAAPAIALAMGYDVGDAIERLDEPD